MTRVSHNGGSPPASAQELRAEVARARDQLADTVSQLAAKADIKSRAQLKAHQARAKMQHQGRHAADQGGGKQGVPLAAAGAGALALIVLAAMLYRHRRT